MDIIYPVPVYKNLRVLMLPTSPLAKRQRPINVKQSGVPQQHTTLALQPQDIGEGLASPLTPTI